MRGLTPRHQSQRALLKGGSDSSDDSGEVNSIDCCLEARSGAGSVGFRSRFAIPSCPLSVARESGVQLHLSALSGLTLLCPGSILTTPSCPFLAAHENGVRPYSVLEVLTLTLSCSRSILTAPPCPFLAVHKSGVWLLIRLVGVDVAPF